MTVALTAWRPTVAEVASLIPQRTGDRDGDAQATFTADTVPTATQVASIVRQIQSEVATRIGVMPVALTVVPDGGTIGESPAGRVVLVGAAAQVEDSFYPDLQTQGGESLAARLWARYRTLLDALVAAAADLATDGTLGNAAPVPRPSAAFPATVAAGYATTPWERW